MKLLFNNKTAKWSCLLIFILHFGLLKGQDENKPVVNIVPVSPTAASLGQFGNIPVGYYTGTANISVPLYEIELDGKKIPINIAYHASGIKVLKRQDVLDWDGHCKVMALLQNKCVERMTLNMAL